MKENKAGARCLLGNFRIPLVLCLLFLISSPYFATGPSSARVAITPLGASDDGVVVFKTEYFINKTGAHMSAGTEYGWLCVSSTGLWQERLFFRAGEDQTGPVSWQQKQKLFSDRTDLHDPPASLRSFMETCGVEDWNTIKPDEGRGRASWQPDRYCVDETCLDQAMSQRSLGDLSSAVGTGSAVMSSFYFSGVAVFRNVEHYESAEPVQSGAQFEIENLFHGEDIGIEMVDVAAIVISDLVVLSCNERIAGTI